MTVGIYKILNKINGMMYVGKSTDMEKRWKRHLYLLKAGKDSCKYLQSAWNKYGFDNFQFGIIEETSLEKLDEKEVFYINKYDTHYTKNGYNISYGGKSPMLGRHHTEDTKRKISENSENRVGKNNPMYNRKQSLETREKISANHVGMTGKFHTEESKEKNRKSKTGQRHSLETIEKMKIAQRKRRDNEKNK